MGHVMPGQEAELTRRNVIGAAGAGLGAPSRGAGSSLEATMSRRRRTKLRAKQLKDEYPGQYDYVVAKASNGSTLVFEDGGSSIAFQDSDARVAINQAIENGSSIFITDGTYVITKGGITLKSDTHIRGSSWDALLQLKDGVNSNLIQGYNKEKITIQNIGLFGNSAVNIHNKDTSESGWGIVLSDIKHSRVQNCFIQKTKIHGITVKDGSLNSLITNNHVINPSADGIRVSDSKDLTVANNVIRRHGDTGIIAGRAGGNGSRNVRIVGNHTEDGASPGIWVGMSRNCMVSNNTVKEIGTYFSIDGIRISDGSRLDKFGTCTGNIVTNNRVFENGSESDQYDCYGIHEYGRDTDPGVARNLITDNIVSNNYDGEINTSAPSTRVDDNLTF